MRLKVQRRGECQGCDEGEDGRRSLELEVKGVEWKTKTGGCHSNGGVQN